jgi:uncharacterized protein GlcG (DUF336 family)
MNINCDLLKKILIWTGALLSYGIHVHAQEDVNFYPEMMGPLPVSISNPILVVEPITIDTSASGPVGIAGMPAAPVGNHLNIDDIKKVLVQAITQANAIGQLATIAVVDRVGNVLAVYRMNGVDRQVTISSTLPATIASGLDNIVLPSSVNGDALAAIAKAITGAYLSSSGNAFSTRTAGQIIQEHFNPGEDNQAAGPLFGVQFSQLPCSDFSSRFNPLTAVGPQRSPLGLAADSGGFPLYKNGEAVGGVGVISDNHYGIDKNIIDFDQDNDELIALAASIDFQPAADIKANRITVDGKTLRYSDVTNADLSVTASNAQDFDNLSVGSGALIAVNGYNTAAIRRGTVFAHAESGIRADTQDFAGLNAFVFVDRNDQLRFPPLAGSDATLLNGVASLSQTEVRELLRAALDVANRARAQIRRPLGSASGVTISVVDSQGNILGMVRNLDAAVFGSDVSLQKARTAAFFSNKDAASFLNSITTATNYLNTDLTIRETILIPGYVTAVQNFVGVNALTDGTAFSDRAGGNLSRPFFADGIQANTNGPLSKSFASNQWSIFSTGLQLDLVMNKILQHVLFAAAGTNPDSNNICTQTSSGRLANGIQIFPGSVPIYRGEQLIGGIGVSGDGVDQDDMVAFLGVHNASINLSGAFNNAPVAMRADNLVVQGVRLRYVQCPQSPFLDSSLHNVCRNK